MEDMGDESGPHNCVHPGPGTGPTTRPTGATDRLNPFAYFHSLLDLGSCALNDVPLAGLQTRDLGVEGDLKKASTTPNYVVHLAEPVPLGVPGTVPGGAPDGAAAADDVLAEWVPRILESPAYREGSVVIVTFGESHAPQGTADPKLVGTLLLSKYLAPGSTDGVGYDPYLMLRSIEDVFSANHLGYANVADGVSFAPPLMGHG